MDMKKLVIASLLFSLFITASAQDKKHKQVEEAVAMLRQAILDGDSLKLDQLTDSELSYGHSAGRLETKKEFVNSLASGESDFESMEVTDQKIVVKNKTAYVRHKIAARIKDKAAANDVKLSVLMVFHKDGKKWKLLARQAVRM